MGYLVFDIIPFFVASVSMKSWRKRSSDFSPLIRNRRNRANVRQEYSTRVSARNPMALSVSSLPRLLTNKRADSGQSHISRGQIYSSVQSSLSAQRYCRLSSTKRKNHEGTRFFDGIKYCNEHDTKIESRLERIFFVSFSRLPSPRKFFTAGREN